MKSYTITVNGNVYDVTVEETGSTASAPVRPIIYPRIINSYRDNTTNPLLISSQEIERSWYEKINFFLLSSTEESHAKNEEKCDWKNELNSREIYCSFFQVLKREVNKKWSYQSIWKLEQKFWWRLWTKIWFTDHF